MNRGPPAGIFNFEFMKPTPTPEIPPANTWWTRNCNGKRYYLRDAPKPFGSPRLYVWIYEENSNRCLHLPLATLLKRYTRYTAPHATTVITQTVA